MRRTALIGLLAWAATAIIANTLFCATPTAWDKAMAKQISVKVKDMLLPDAVGLLLKNTGIAYVVDPQVKKLKVTAILKNVPLQKALGEVAKAAGATCRKESDKKLRIVGPRDPVASSVATTPASKQPGSGKTVTATITLNYVAPGDVAPIISKLGHLEVAASSGSKIVLVGDAESVAKAQEIIKMLDVPEALPRSVRVKLVASIVKRSDSREGPGEVSVDNTGPEGTDIPLEVGGGRKDKRFFSHHAPISVIMNCKPVVPPDLSVDNHITITAEGMFIGAPEADESLIRSFQTTTSVVPGKPQVIVSGSFVSDDTNETYDYSLTLTVTIEEGRLRVRPVESNQVPCKIDIKAEIWETSADTLANLDIDWSKGAGDTQIAVIKAGLMTELLTKLQNTGAKVVFSQVAPAADKTWVPIMVTTPSEQNKKAKLYEMRVLPHITKDNGITLSIGYLSPEKRGQILQKQAAAVLNGSTNELLRIQLMDRFDVGERVGNPTLKSGENVVISGFKVSDGRMLIIIVTPTVTS